MKKFKFIALFILLSVLITAFAAPCTFAAEAMQTESKAALLVEVGSGSVMYADQINERLAPASTTKVMTVLLAVEAIESGRLDLNDMVTATETAMSDLAEDGSTQQIQVGETMSLRDLLYCAMVASANEACNIIAEHVAGSKEAFVEQMNRRAQELGCENTHFVNTHGLTAEGHYTSAWDLYLIFSEAIGHETFMQLIGTYEYQTDVTNMTSERRALTNTNKLIDPYSGYHYDYCLGGKTGSTEAAGYCLVSVADNDGVKLIAVVLGAEVVEDDDGDVNVMSFVETRRLFRWGFDNFSYQTLLSTTDLVKEVPVEMGSGRSTVVLRPEKDIIVFMDNDITSDYFDMEYRIYCEEEGEKLRAPIKEGEVLGEMSISYEGKDYGTVRLVANTGVELNHMSYLKIQIGNFFSNTFVKIVLITVAVLLLAYIALVVRYNMKRKAKKQAERAKRAEEEVKAKSRLTTGKTFEEIYDQERE